MKMTGRYFAKTEMKHDIQLLYYYFVFAILVSTCSLSLLILATDRIAMIPLSTIFLLVLELTRWHPEGLNLPMAERCCSNVLPIAGAVGTVLFCHLKSFWM